LGDANGPMGSVSPTQAAKNAALKWGPIVGMGTQVRLRTLPGIHDLFRKNIARQHSHVVGGELRPGCPSFEGWTVKAGKRERWAPVVGETRWHTEARESAAGKSAALA
jgi:hypothetical protein